MTDNEAIVAWIEQHCPEIDSIYLRKCLAFAGMSSRDLYLSQMASKASSKRFNQRMQDLFKEYAPRIIGAKFEEEES